MIYFTKMEGIGNDYIYINGFKENIPNPKELAISMSEQHFGCGADGLILILPSEIADFKMRMFNKDGSESEMCGNGMRCVARYCYDKNLTDKTEFSVESGGAIKYISLKTKFTNTNTKPEVVSITVDMGTPKLLFSEIPVISTKTQDLTHELSVGNETYITTLVNMGNPHAVLFIQDNVQCAPVLTLGPMLECHTDFPQKANIEFAQILDSSNINMRVWERGSGETLACGTGACAVCVAGVLRGLCNREVNITLPGGTLQIHWNKENNHVYLTGPANYVYEGTWLK